MTTPLDPSTVFIDTLDEVQGHLRRHEAALLEQRERLLALDMAMKDDVKPALDEHGERLDDHAKQLAALKNVPLRLDSIWLRMDNLEDWQKQNAAKLNEVSIGLSAQVAELRVARTEQRTGYEMLANLILEAKVPPAAAEPDLRAQNVGLQTLNAVANRTIDDQRRTIEEQARELSALRAEKKADASYGGERGELDR